MEIFLLCHGLVEVKAISVKFAWFINIEGKHVHWIEFVCLDEVVSVRIVRIFNNFLWIFVVDKQLSGHSLMNDPPHPYTSPQKTKNPKFS